MKAPHRARGGQPIVADVLVIGAGLSGLAAARRLGREGVAALVLEARPAAGGRTRALRHDALELEGGAEFVKATLVRVRKLAAELGVGLISRPAGEGLNVRVHAGARYEESRTLSASPVAERAYGAALERLDAMASTLPAGRPWAAPDAARWDSVTVAAWTTSALSNDEARVQIERDLVFGLGGTASGTSLLQALHYHRSAGGLLASIDGHSARLQGGGSALAAALVGDLGTEPLLDSPVTKLVQAGQRVHAWTGDALVAMGNFAILAVSPTLARRIAFEPEPPLRRALLHERWTQGAAIKALLVYERPWWHDHGLSGHAAGDLAVESVADVSPPDSAGRGILAAFANTSERTPHAIAAGTTARRAAILRALCGYLGPEAGTPIAYLELDWRREKWAGGCASFLPPGVLTGFGPSLRERFERIVWAGTEAARHGFGSMEGALDAGTRAAAAVARLLAREADGHARAR